MCDVLFVVAGFLELSSPCALVAVIKFSSF